MTSHNIQYFPSNVLEKIFSYVDGEDLCNSIPRVCENWRLVSSSCHMLLKRAAFNGSSISSKDICFSLQNASRLTSVSFVNVSDIVPVVRQMCRCNQNVERVKIKDCSSKGDLIPECVLINMLLSLKNLSGIQISGTKFYSHLFYEVLATMTNVTCIDFSSNNCVTLTDLMIIAHNCKIQEFKMSRRSRQVEISDYEMSYLIATMSPYLFLLHLDMYEFGTCTYNEICNCFKLKDVTLNNAMSLTADQVSKLSKLLNVIRLKIEGPSLLRNGDLHTSLFENSTLSRQLLVLKLVCFNCLWNTECSTILNTCKGLKMLSLRACKSITIEGISAALLNVVNLEYLNIANIRCIKGIELVAEKLELLTLVLDEDACCRSCNISVLKTILTVVIVNKNVFDD